MDADAVGPEMTGTRPEHTPERDAVDPLADHDLEPPLLAAVAVGGAALAGAVGAGRGAWTAAATLGVLAASAWLARRRDPRPPVFALRACRSGLALAAAAVAVGVGHGTAAAMLAWFPAVCAVYTLVFGAGAATAFTTAALGVLALVAADPPQRGPSETAFAACAVAVLAVSLAARTLRAVVAALAGGRGPVAGREAPSPTTTVVPVATTLVPVTTTLVPAVRPLTAGVTAPASLPGHAELMAAAAGAQRRSGVVGGDIALLVLTLQGAGSLAGSIGPGAAADVLATLARRARAWLPAGDVVAWLPGDRLAVLLEGVDAATCAVVARRLAALVGEPVDAGQQVVSLPAAATWALARGPHEPPAELLRRAEDPASVAGEPAAPAPAVALPDTLAGDLRVALAAGDVTVALQPVVALGALPRHDRVVAVEALARWTRADGTSVPPARFVAAARRGGFADLLGGAVLAQSLEALRERHAAGRPDLGLSVNLAPEQLAGGTAATILGALDTAGIAPAALTVEVPAAAAFDDAAAAREALGMLRDAGVGVALDNFGAAGLSIAALRDLPLTAVKLDRSLTADLGADDRLVVATVRLTTRLGLTCTAVGVETRTQLDAARSLGIDAVQGHLLGHPEPARSRPVEAEVAVAVPGAH